MSDIALDLTTQDIEVFGTDLRVLSEQSEATTQRLKIRLLFFRGEWFLNIDYGIPYYEEIYTKNVTQAAVDNIFRDQILDTEGVTSITSFESTFDKGSRAYSLTFSCLAESGEIITINI